VYQSAGMISVAPATTVHAEFSCVQPQHVTKLRNMPDSRHVRPTRNRSLTKGTLYRHIFTARGLSLCSPITLCHQAALVRQSHQALQFTARTNRCDSYNAKACMEGGDAVSESLRETVPLT
jgi:hypothetical protein